MKKLTFPLIMLLMAYATIPVAAQNLNFGITINPGLSQITNVKDYFPLIEEVNNLPALSGTAGIFLEKRLTNNILIGGELLWIRMEAHEKASNQPLTMWTGTPPNQVLDEVGFVTHSFKFHTTYLGLPMYFKFQAKKLGIKAGMQANLFLQGSYDYNYFGELNGEPFSDKSSSTGSFDQFDYGPRVGLDYILSERFRLKMDFYHGLPNINPEGAPWARRTRQLTLGINYSIKLKKAIETFSWL